MKIGVKFCGGCHVAYDRMEAFNRIKEALKGEAEFVSYDDEESDLILVIMGCPSACVDTEVFDQAKVWIVKSLAEADVFIGEARGLKKKN